MQTCASDIAQPSSYARWKQQGFPSVAVLSKLRCGGNYQFGLTTGGAAFGLSDQMMLDFLFLKYPKLCNVTELGTAIGLTTVRLATMARFRDESCTVHTFDIHSWRDVPRVGVSDESRVQVARAWRRTPEIVPIFTDILSSANPLVAQSMNRSENQLVFIDNGNKIKEMHLYLKYATPGTVVITHDWPYEIAMPAIQDVIDEEGFVPLYHDFAEHIGSHVRAFVKADDVHG